MADEHQPVLLDEVVEALNIYADGFYIDGTFGRGGHSQAILQRLGDNGRLLAFDKDPDAIAAASSEIISDKRFTLVQGSFTMLKHQVEQHNVSGKVAGILLDFGVSSPQIDNPDRGFSFRFDGPLDMRMDTSKGLPVSEWLNSAKEKAIADVIYQYGEEHASRRIAKAIMLAREQKPIITTRQLAELIRSILPARKQDIHPATKTFQALRIFINDELVDIEAVLPDAVDVLATNGRLVTISFHSLEDRIVKRFIRDQSSANPIPREIPVMPDESSIRLKKIGKKIKAGKQEVEQNPRARSAVARVAEKLH
ncbi:MAG: 16S rRNA (cytosine(1402)-N(4))-methyltransferase RsmH [Pseudomonadota bacterium]